MKSTSVVLSCGLLASNIFLQKSEQLLRGIARTRTTVGPDMTIRQVTPVEVKLIEVYNLQNVTMSGFSVCHCVLLGWLWSISWSPPPPPDNPWEKKLLSGFRSLMVCVLCLIVNMVMWALIIMDYGQYL